MSSSDFALTSGMDHFVLFLAVEMRWQQASARRARLGFARAFHSDPLPPLRGRIYTDGWTRGELAFESRIWRSANHIGRRRQMRDTGQIHVILMDKHYIDARSAARRDACSSSSSDGSVRSQSIRIAATEIIRLMSTCAPSSFFVRLPSSIKHPHPYTSGVVKMIGRLQRRDG